MRCLLQYGHIIQIPATGFAIKISDKKYASIFYLTFLLNFQFIKLIL